MFYYENASVLFPAISAVTILVTLLCGALLFKEKLKIFKKKYFFKITIDKIRGGGYNRVVYV